MITFLKSLIFKFRPFQIYPRLDAKKKNDGDTLSEVISKLKNVENRLVEAEKACDLRSNEQKLKDLEERFEEEIKIFPLLERKFLRLEIDRRILLECPETAKKTSYLPWNNSKNGQTAEQNIGWWYYRIYFLFVSKEKIYKFRRDSFLVIQNNKKQSFQDLNRKSKND